MLAFKDYNIPQVTIPLWATPVCRRYEIDVDLRQRIQTVRLLPVGYAFSWI